MHHLKEDDIRDDNDNDKDTLKDKDEDKDNDKDKMLKRPFMSHVLYFQKAGSSRISDMTLTGTRTETKTKTNTKTKTKTKTDQSDQGDQQGYQGEASIIILGMLESSGFQK